MSTSTFVAQLYTRILGRAPDHDGLAFWTTAIDSGNASAASVTRQFIDSPEFANVVQPLARLYFAAFGRIPDQSGLLFWTANAQQGESYGHIVRMFAESSEFSQLYGKLDNSAFLDALARTALGHGMDAGSKSDWLAKLSAGSATRTDVLSSVVSSAEMTAAKADAVKVIAQYYGTVGTVPTTQQLADALTARDADTLITKLYASADYDGAPVPNLNAHGVVTDARGSGATVFIDANANGKLDAGEISTKADGAGHFDFGSHAAFNGVLTVLPADGGAAYTAPAGAATINALTTLVQSVAAAAHIDAASADLALRGALGIRADVSLLDTDPTVLAADPTLALSVREAGASMQAAAAQIGTLLSEAGAALCGLGITADAAAADAAALQAVASFVADPNRQGAIDLANSGAIQTVLKAAATLLHASPVQLAALSLAAPELATVIANINSAIANVAADTPSALVNQVGLIESNAAAALAKLAGGDVAGALDLTSQATLTKMHAVTMNGGGEGVSSAGAPIRLSSDMYTDMLTIVFNEDVMAGSGKIVISDGNSQTKYNAVTGKLETRVVGATDTHVIDIHDSHVTFDGGMLKVTGLNLSTSKNYAVLMERGVVVDSSGESFAGFSDAGQLRDTPLDSATTSASSARFATTGAFKAGDTIYIEIYFNGDVTVPNGVTPTMTLTGGRVATYDSKPGVATLKFKYVVQASDNASALDLVSKAGLADKIHDAGTGLALDSAHINFEHINDNGYGVILDNTAPSYTLSIDQNAFSDHRDHGQVTLQFSEAVTGVSLSDFDAEYGTVNNLTTTDGITWHATFTATHLGNDTSNVITYAPAAAHDPAGNVATGSVSTSNYVIDNVAPVPTVAATIASDQAVTATFDEAVFATGTGTIMLERDDHMVTSIQLGDVTFSADHKTVTIAGADTLADGHGYSISWPSGLTDAAGNPYGGADSTFTIPSTTPPTALEAKFSDTADVDKLLGEDVSFTVTFDRAVFVEAADHPTIHMNTGHDAVFEAVEDATHLRFTYTVHEGDSVEDLEMIDATGLLSAVHDNNGHFLDGSHIAFESIADGYGGPLHLDGTVPTLTARIPLEGDNLSSDIYMQFSEPVHFNSSGDFQIWKVAEVNGDPDTLVSTIHGSDVEQLHLQDMDAVAGNETVQLSPELPEPGLYYVILAGQPVLNSAGNPYLGMTQSGDFQFGFYPV